MSSIFYGNEINNMKTMKTAEEAAKEYRKILYRYRPQYPDTEIDAKVIGFIEGFESRQPEINKLQARIAELENALHQRTAL